MIWLPSILASLSPKIIGGGVAVLVLLSAYGCEVHRQRQIGVQKERASVEKTGEKTNVKATNARRDAERRAPDSLREYVRD